MQKLGTRLSEKWCDLGYLVSSTNYSCGGPPKTKLSNESVAQRQIGNTARPHLIFTRRTHPIPRSQQAWKLEILSPKNTACQGTVRDRASQRNRPTFADIITASGLLLPRLPDVWPSWLGETALPCGLTSGRCMYAACRSGVM